MKTYKTPKIKAIKLDTEELMNQMAPASLTGSTISVNAYDARSKGAFRIFDDGEDEGYGE